MLITVLIWAYSLTIFYLYGLGGLTLLKKALHLQDETSTLPFPITTIAGMAVVTTLASYLSLFIPLAGFAAGIILMGGVIIAVRTSPFEKFKLPSLHGLIWILLTLTGLSLLENATHSPTNPDTALYHAQAIHWVESYHVVPGLANLHNRLAYNSSWLVLNAVFSFGFTKVRSFHLTNSALLLCSLIYFGNGLQNLLRKQFAFADIVKSLFFILSIYLYTSEISSPTTDLPATLLIWMVVAFLIEKSENHGMQFNLFGSAIFALIIFALAVKLSALPLAIVAAFWTIQRVSARDWRRATALVGVGLLILLPWFLRSIVLSGYLIFPLPQIDIFTFDWKYPLESVVATRDGILWFARFPNKNWKDFVGLPLAQWIPLWFENLTRNQKNMVILAAISPLGLLTYRAIRSGKELPKGYFFIWLVNYLGVFFWFLTAPDMRFGYGFLMATIVVAMAPYLRSIFALDRQLPAFPPILYVVAILVFQGLILVSSVQPSTLRQRLLLPADYLPSHAEACPIRNGLVFCREEGYQCNYDNFPCIPAPRPNIEMRGASLQDGFRNVP